MMIYLTVYEDACSGGSTSSQLTRTQTHSRKVFTIYWLLIVRWWLIYELVSDSHFPCIHSVQGFFSTRLLKILMGGKGGFDANLLESKSTLESVHY